MPNLPYVSIRNVVVFFIMIQLLWLLLMSLIPVLFVIFVCECLQQLTNIEIITDNSDIHQEIQAYRESPTENAVLECDEATAISDNTIETATYTEDKDIATCPEYIESSTIDKESATFDIKSVDFDVKSVDFDTESATLVKKSTIFNFETSIIENIVNGKKTTSVAREPINLLNLTRNTKMSKMYEINGSTFVENDCTSSHDNDSPVHYELFKVEMVKTDGDAEDEDMTTEMDIHIQTLPQGLIINSNVFLSNPHWNCMALIDGDLFRCAVCQTYCDRSDCMDHVESAAHRRNMDKYKPLKRFDLSIIRKINVNLHCGVCNDIFDIMDYKTHESSKSHEGNLLTAINKVSDLMYDANMHRNVYMERDLRTIDRNSFTAYRNVETPARNIQAPARNSQIPPRNVQSPGISDQSPDRNFESPDINVQTPDYRNNYEFHFDANAINNNNINVYEEFSDSDEDEEYLDEIEEYTTPYQGISYASMAKKPRMELPKFLKIDLGTKEVRVNFDSWHMIIRPKINKYYCMVCNKEDHIRFKSQHCISCEHVEKLAICTVVGAFEDYLIRKVGDKLYHCGHCNNLQYQNEMSIHIEKAHPKKNKNIIDDVNSPVKPKKTSKNNDKINLTKNKSDTVKCEKSESEKSDILNKSIEYRIETKTAPVIDVFGDVTLAPFGPELRITALSLNIIMKREDGYYCAVCDKACEDVKAHVEDLSHMEMMNMTPFIRPFQNNLTRAVRGTLHCGLCNILVMASEILNHNMDQPHTTALANALGMQKNRRPDKNDKNTYFTPQTSSTTLDKSSIGRERAGAGLEKASIGLDKVSTGLDKASTGLDKNSDKSTPLTVIPPVITNNLQPKSQSPNILNRLDQSSTIRSPMISPNQLAKENNGTGAKKSETYQNGAQGQNGNSASNLNQRESGQRNEYAGQNIYYGQNPNAGQNNQIFPPLYNPEAFPALPKLDSHTLNYISHLNSVNYPKLNVPRAPFQPYPLAPQNINQPNTKNFIQSNNHTQNINNGQKSPNPDIHKNSVIVTTPKKDEINRNGVANNMKVEIKTTDDIIKSVYDTKSIDDYSKSEKECENVDSQSDDELKEFDEREFVYLKLKTAFFKITNLSYNTLVYLENGVRYCFVCSNSVPTPTLQKHVDSREHIKNIAENKFLDKYGVQLFRQMYLMYHCAICNVLMTRKEIKLHLDWSIHIENYNVAHKTLNKKNRKELKSGIKEYLVETQKEAIFCSAQHKINIVATYQIVPNLGLQKDTPTSPLAKKSTSTAVKKNKMVILNKVVMKVGFDHWHGISSAKNVTKCIICQTEIKSNEVLEHVETEYHGVALGKTFEKAYYPALVRKINDNIVNCMICNLEVLNNEYLIHEHLNGRKHGKNQESVVNESLNHDSYADCYEEYLNL